MAAITPASIKKHSAGDQTKLTAKFTSVSDADTWASGLGSRVQEFVYQVTADPTLNTSAGCNVVESSGTFTFYPGVDALSGTLIVWATGA